MRRVDHECGFGDGGIIGDVPYETFHFLRAVQHGVVHVDVDDAGSVFYLPGCNLQGFVVFAFGNEAGEFPGSGHIRAFADVGEVVVCDVYCDGLQSADL